MKRENTSILHSFLTTLVRVLFLQLDILQNILESGLALRVRICGCRFFVTVGEEGIEPAAIHNLASSLVRFSTFSLPVKA